MILSPNGKFIEALSQERFSSYEILCPTGKESDLIGAYHWNLAICSSLYPFLQSAEIALRNSMHEALSNKFNTTEWYDLISLNPVSKKKIEETKQELIRHQKPTTAPNIVASLTFGFWEKLLSHRYYANQDNPYCLWPHLIPDVFPDYKIENRSARKQIAKRFGEIKNLRNRLFHHEPIWKFKNRNTAEKNIASLITVFNDMVKAIGWISKEKKQYLRAFGFVSSFRELCDISCLEKYKQISREKSLDSLNREPK